MHCPETFEITYMDCSGLDCFSRCPFRYMLSRCMGLVSQGAPRNYFAYGRILHECLPLVYDHTFDEVMDHFNTLWAVDGFDGDDKRNPECARLLLQNFWNARQPHNCPYDIVELDIEKLEVVDSVSRGEIPFLVDLGAALPFAGRIDMPVRLKQTGTLWAMDYKTTQDIGPRLFESFENHPQALGYPIALSLLTGEEVSGLIVEALRVAKPTKKPSKTPPHQWHPVYINEQKMKWFIEWAEQKASEILYYNRAQEWPRELSSCSSYAQYGIPGGICQYQNMCANYGDNWYEYVRYFDREPWHPFTLANTGPEVKPAQE
jgi:hypothetical protein